LKIYAENVILECKKVKNKDKNVILECKNKLKKTIIEI
jgi:hypothetical protein